MCGAMAQVAIRFGPIRFHPRPYRSFRFETESSIHSHERSQIHGRDTFWPLLVDGGLYLKKGMSKPDTIYIIRNDTGVPAKVNIGDRANVTMVK